ncbi:MAG: hypothetical protein ACM3MH_11165 [Actinomycetota bacterium]
MRHTVSLPVEVAALLVSLVAAAAAEDSATPTSPVPNSSVAAPAEGSPSAEDKRELTPEEKAEKEARKACKKSICDILATRDPSGDDVACDITKTWREEDITKMLGGKISWPWGKAVCQSKFEIKRAALAKAKSEPEYEVALDPQQVSCTLAQKDAGEPYQVKITLAPKVKFKDGKATEATLNWGDASAPLLVYPLIYAGTGLDNQTNVLGPQVVRMVHEFATRKCAEVKAELSVDTPN